MKGYKMYLKDFFEKDKKLLKIALFNDFFLESIYIENKIFNALINDILKLLKVNHDKICLSELIAFFKSFIIINDDQFLENHFKDICIDVEQWYSDYKNIFEQYNDFNVNELKKLSKSGDMIMKKIENNIEILRKYLEE